MMSPLSKPLAHKRGAMRYWLDQLDLPSLTMPHLMLMGMRKMESQAVTSLTTPRFKGASDALPA